MQHHNEYISKSNYGVHTASALRKFSLGHNERSKRLSLYRPMLYGFQLSEIITGELFLGYLMELFQLQNSKA
jgi:hypothetical protein